RGSAPKTVEVVEWVDSASSSSLVCFLWRGINPPPDEEEEEEDDDDEEEEQDENGGVDDGESLPGSHCRSPSSTMGAARADEDECAASPRLKRVSCDSIDCASRCFFFPVD